LADILWNRVEYGLAAGAITDTVVEGITDHAAGDARHGIVLLRKAAWRAQRTGASQITLEDVRETAADARNEIIDRYLSSFGTDIRLLFEIIREQESIRGDELKQMYNERASDPVGHSRRNDYLRELETHGRIKSEGAGRGKRYRVAERK
jgi:Cdc6-like AAA superfamily ATPase